jgi:hypothetical protein
MPADKGNSPMMKKQATIETALGNLPQVHEEDDDNSEKSGMT